MFLNGWPSNLHVCHKCLGLLVIVIYCWYYVHRIGNKLPSSVALRAPQAPGEFTVSLVFHKHLLPGNWPLSAPPAAPCRGLSCPWQGPTARGPRRDSRRSRTSAAQDMANGTSPSPPPACVSSQRHARVFSQQSPELLASPFSLPNRRWVSKKIDHYGKAVVGWTEPSAAQGLPPADRSPPLLRHGRAPL